MIKGSPISRPVSNARINPDRTVQPKQYQSRLGGAGLYSQSCFSLVGLDYPPQSPIWI